MSVGKPKQETISLILPLTARNCARLCDLLAVRPFPQIAQKTLSFPHFTEREKITKMMIIFKTPAILVCFLRHDPVKPQTSVQRLAHTRNVTTCCCKQIARAIRLHSSIDSWFKVIFDCLSINSARVGSLHCYVTKQSKCIMCFRPS